MLQNNFLQTQTVKGIYCVVSEQNAMLTRLTVEIFLTFVSCDMLGSLSFYLCHMPQPPSMLA